MRTYSEAEINELVFEAQAKDNAAFDKLMIYFRPPIINMIYRCIRDKSLIDDCYQEVLIRVFLGLPGFKGGSRFFTWLYRISLNVVHNYSRGNYRQSVSIENSHESMNLLTGRYRLREYTTPESLLYSQEVEDYFCEIISGLPEGTSDVLMRHDVDGDSYEDIAELLHCSESTVRSRISRARAQIDQQMKTFLRYC